MPTEMRERIEIGRDATNKPIYRWACGRNKKEVYQSIARLHVQFGLLEGFDNLSVQEVPQKSGITFKAYAEKWLELYKAPKLKPTTLRGYRSTLNTHFLPAFGRKPIESITTDDVQKYLNERKDLARKTLHTQLMVLGEIFADAMEDGHIQKSPTNSRKLTIPSTKKTVRNALLPEQVLDVIGQLGNLEGTEKRLMALILLTGMRRGEVLGLKWEDIDVEAGLIHIVRNVTYPYNQPTIGTPKSKQGIRTIPLDKQLWQMLQPVETGYIIGSDVPIARMVFTRMWNRIEKKVNLYGATPHIFRHSYLTIASNAGIDPKTIQALAGHADIATTMNIYVHQQTDHLIKAGETINAHLFPEKDE